MAGPEQSSSDKPAPPPPDQSTKKKPVPDRPEDELSEEDQALKDKLELLVTRAMDSDAGVQKLALESIRTEIRSATSSMTSVPKPLKFLRPHFTPLKTYYAESIKDADNKVALADVLSVLSMTMGDANRCESLRFKVNGSSEPPHLWGHEYVRHLAGEIAAEYLVIADLDGDMQDDTDPESHPGPHLRRATMNELNTLVGDIVPFLISSNAEPEAVDLLMEVNRLPDLVTHTDSHNYSRVCLYLKACAAYIPEPQKVDEVLRVCSDIYVKVAKLPQAMEVAIRRRDSEAIKGIYKTDGISSSVRLQLALDIGRAGIILDDGCETNLRLRMAMNNREMYTQFHSLAKDLDVLEAKSPEDIYKSHLLDNRSSSAANMDSARANLASTFVNAFVNMGFGSDKLMTDSENRWIYRNKEHGMMSAAASVGMLGLWDVDTGLGDIDKYMYAEQDYVRAGALLGVGLVSVNVRHEMDPVAAILEEHITSDKPAVRHGAIAGLGLAYAGSERKKVKEMLLPLLMDGDMSADTVSFAALSLGLTFIGSADEDLSVALFQVLTDRKDSGDITKEPLLPIFLPLSFGLLFLGRQEAAEAALSVTAVEGSDSLIGRLSAITLEACAYCSSGHVEKVQKFLSLCGEHPTSEDNEDASDSATSAANGQASGGNPESASANAAGTNGSTPGANQAGASRSSPSGQGQSSTTNADGSGTTNPDTASIASAEQAVAVLGLAMVAMGEELGAEMSIRAFGHLLQYGDPVIRRVVPLAIGLLSVSNPNLSLMDMLSKFTHDSDMDVAQSAIIGLGLIGAGTNNARIAGILRQLSIYYSKEPSSLFLVRIAQGLLHSGKGLITMNPFYGDNKFLENRAALGGLLTMLFSCLDMKGTILGKNHFLLFFLALSARPRMVFTVDEEMQPKATTVRVGQAVDTVGQAGRPKSITGFQTHTTPVLLAAGERAEMATDEYLAVAASMEGIVVIEKNPDWVDESGLSEAASAMEKGDKSQGESKTSAANGAS